jgi:hypothetical protein
MDHGRAWGVSRGAVERPSLGSESRVEWLCAGRYVTKSVTCHLMISHLFFFSLRIPHPYSLTSPAAFSILTISWLASALLDRTLGCTAAMPRHPRPLIRPRNPPQAVFRCFYYRNESGSVFL